MSIQDEQVQNVSTAHAVAPKPTKANVGISSFQALSITVALLVTAAFSFLAGVVYNRQQSLASADEFAVFWEAWDLVEDDYFFVENLPNKQDRVYGAIQGFISSLDDANSRFAPPVLAEDNREHIEGRFGGIGAVVSMTENNEPYIVEVIQDECIATTPADEAGLMSNDVIRAVDGTSVEGLDINGVVEQVRGPQGSTVTLTIFRPVQDETLDIDVRRDSIENITVRTEMYDDVAYMRLDLFNAVATKQMLCKLDGILADNPRALILDLQGNPGGLLNEALLVADIFLDDGVVLVQRDRRGTVETLTSDNGDIGEDIPLYVLVNGGSASASEVVAGALQDRDRATLIGQTTYGKGSVQNVYELSDESELRITAAAWFTPDDHQIQDQGLTPDELVACDPQGTDCAPRTLETALDVINSDLPPEDESNLFAPNDIVIPGNVQGQIQG